MATVYIGSARIDERGNATGGAAGDQTGGEVSKQPWYKHSLGWVVIRAKDAAARTKIASAMRSACNNPKIGYDQNQRDTLYNVSKPVGFDPSKVTSVCECDCSSLVRVCCNFAGIPIGNIRTATEPTILKNTGKFDVLTDPSYTDHPERLMTGDILCTPVSGHTVVVLNDGERAHDSILLPAQPAAPFSLQNVPTLKFGVRRSDAVAYMQYLLAEHGYKLPKSVDAKHKYGFDGWWWTLFKKDCETEKVFRQFQKEHCDLDGKPLEVDGSCGPLSWGALTGKRCK